MHSGGLYTSAEPGSLPGLGYDGGGVALGDPGEVARRRLWLAAKVLLGLLGVALLVALALLRTWPPLQLVASGSMEPTIDTGDVVVMQRLSRPARIGDIVAVHPPQRVQSNLNYPATVIHRVVAISPRGEVRTKGDARSQRDPFVTPLDGIDTRVIWTIPGIGGIVAFFTSPLGLAWLGLGLVLFMLVPHLELKRDQVELKRVELGSLAEIRAELRSVAQRVEADRAGAEPGSDPRAPL